MHTLGRFGHKSLPTYYKGIKFRSRLEARWAIILDELGIAWEYEPEAFEIEGWPETFNYLPDFYLPKLDSFLEIKGFLDDNTYLRIMQIALTITKGQAAGDKNGRPFLIAGPIPPAPHLPIVWSIYNYKGELRGKKHFLHQHAAFESFFKNVNEDFEYLCNDFEWRIPDKFVNGYLLESVITKSEKPIYREWKAAVEKARNIRFENGCHV